MEILKRKFYKYGILLIFCVALALYIQYEYLNEFIVRQKEENIIEATEHLSYHVEDKLSFYSHYVNSVEDFLKTNLDGEGLNDFLNILIDRESGIRTVYFVSVEGQVTYSGDLELQENYDPYIRPWYLNAIKTDKIVISEIYNDALDGREIITISKPMYDKNGNLLGVIGEDILIEEIINIVQSTNIEGIGNSFLIDKNINVLANIGFDRRLEDAINNENIIDFNNAIKNLGAKDLKQIKLNGTDGYLNYKQLDDYDWIVGHFISLDEFRGGNRDIYQLLIMGVLISFVIVFLFGYLFRRHIGQPLINFYKDVQKINPKGNGGYRLPIDENDPFLDIRLLANSIIQNEEILIEQHQQDTEEIIAQNEELETSFQQLQKFEEELRQNYSDALKSKEELREVLDKNRAILDALPDLILVINKSGTISEVQVSSKSDEFKGASHLIGKDLSAIFPVEIKDNLVKSINEVIEEDAFKSLEHEVIDTNGKRDYESRVVRLNDNNVLSVIRDITEKKEIESKLIELGYRDKLTGLYNRRYFEETLKVLDKEENLPISIIMSDINGLKLINDSMGHDLGDRLITTVARIIKFGVRQDDIVSRVSGDEFVVIMPKTSHDSAVKVVDRIKLISKNTTLEKSELSDMELSASFGVSTKETMGVDINNIIKKAETKMYSYKLFEGSHRKIKTLNSMINSIHEKSNKTKVNASLVSDFAIKLGKKLNLPDKDLEDIERVSYLRDIGKISIPDDLLEKEESLTKGEIKQIKKHPEIGYRILNTIDEMNDIARYVLYHHENYDGTGYPKGLKGKEIPLISRILNITVAYVSMMTDKKYKDSLKEDEIIREFKEKAGRQFDPELVKIFLEEVLGHKWI